MSVKAKTILKDRFWIVEDEGVRIGTLSLDEEKYMLNTADGDIKFFDNMRQLESKLGKTEFENDQSQTANSKDVYGFATRSVAYNKMYDVKRKLPLFTKSKSSKSLYCAGYYIIRFSKGWVKSFCPKLITVERYDTKGPFKTEFEMKQELRRANQ
jgi:hypothetical protein